LKTSLHLGNILYKLFDKYINLCENLRIKCILCIRASQSDHNKAVGSRSVKILKKKKMEKKLFVGNLPYSVTSEMLGETFAPAGSVVSAAVIVDKFSKRSKGFGFVEMSTEEEAEKAKEMFDQSELEGRKIFVSEARPMANRDDFRK